VTDQPTDPPVEELDEQSTLLSNSAVMAAGTTISRLTGFVRAALLSYALGRSVHADVFNVANSLPNMLYILLAGGIFNAVLVPQLVRSLRNDPDRGDAYTSRVVTVAGLFLIAVTVLLVVAAPLLVDLVAPSYDGAVRESAIAFTRLCLPQVFFYGMFVLVGQILNARESFGPMMWAPIANNVISVAVLVVYIVGYGQAEGAEVHGPFSSGQELLLGLGSGVGREDLQRLLVVALLPVGGIEEGLREEGVQHGGDGLGGGRGSGDRLLLVGAFGGGDHRTLLDLECELGCFRGVVAQRDPQGTVAAPGEHEDRRHEGGDRGDPADDEERGLAGG